MDDSMTSSQHRDVQLNISPPPALLWHEILQGMFLAPFETLNKLKDAYDDPAAIDTPLLRQQAMLSGGVILLQILWSAVQSMASSSGLESMGTSVGIQAIFHLGIWFLLAGGIAVAGVVFEGRSRYGLLLTLTGASTLPWLLIPIVGLLKQAVPAIGGFVFVLLWLWTSLLFLQSIRKSFGWDMDRLVLAMSLPTIFWVWWGLAIFSFFFGLSH